MANTEPNIRPQFWCFFTRNISAQWDTPVFKVSSNKIHVSPPPEIVFLRSPTPSHLPHVDSPEIVYDILEGNVQNSFDIIKRLDHGMIVGECHYGMWLTMPADRRPSPEASLSGNYICIKWFSDLISHYERFSSFFLFFKQTKCICVSLREHVSGKHESTWRGLFNLTRSDSVIPILVLLMIGLQSQWHLLRPSRLHLKTFIHVLFILSPCFSFAISMWPCFPLLWHDRL